MKQKVIEDFDDCIMEVIQESKNIKTHTIFSNLLKNKDLFDLSSFMNAVIIIFGTAFLILNTLFPLFNNIAQSNWIVGFLMAVGLFLFSAISNYDEYKNNCYPKIYQIWMIGLYPILMFGLILSLIYINCVDVPVYKGLLNWTFGLSLALTFITATYFDNKYDELDEQEAWRDML